ncbi:hypothetical protein RRG08_038691 [Elysia crispata]|uniref:Uncharacterized protein n=1 Tax=Elysia crispata TaxID=231223 RepID=A0AAE0ZIZ8_9GAST|nr:hypothetical protein RRG08_038691 [Elysia crispata]
MHKYCTSSASPAHRFCSIRLVMEKSEATHMKEGNMTPWLLLRVVSGLCKQPVMTSETDQMFRSHCAAYSWANRRIKIVAEVTHDLLVSDDSVPKRQKSHSRNPAADTGWLTQLHHGAPRVHCIICAHCCVVMRKLKDVMGNSLLAKMGRDRVSSAARYDTTGDRKLSSQSQV